MNSRKTKSRRNGKTSSKSPMQKKAYANVSRCCIVYALTLALTFTPTLERTVTACENPYVHLVMEQEKERTESNDINQEVEFINHENVSVTTDVAITTNVTSTTKLTTTSVTTTSTTATSETTTEEIVVEDTYYEEEYEEDYIEYDYSDYETEDTYYEEPTEIVEDTYTESVEVGSGAEYLEATFYGVYSFDGYTRTGMGTHGASGNELISGGSIALNTNQRQVLGLNYGDYVYLESASCPSINGYYRIDDCGCSWGTVDIFYWAYTTDYMPSDFLSTGRVYDLVLYY